MLRFLMAVGVIWWASLAVWLVRLAMGLEHLGGDQIAPGIVGGVCGGLGAWWLVPRLMRKEAEKAAK